MATLTFRLLGPSVLSPGSPWLPLLFALFVPVGGVFFCLGTSAVGVRGAAALPAVLILTFTALLLDGLALIFLPTVYGLPTESLLIVAALLL